MALLIRRLCGAGHWLLASLFVGVPLGAAQVAENDVKAAYLYNFTRFVQWPRDVPAANEPFRLCVIADATLTAAIRRTMDGESVNGRGTETLVPRSAKDVRTCQILFVGRSVRGRAASLLAAARELPILTVSDAEGFAKSGDGTIEFVRDDGRVRFEVNVEAAKRCGLSISSRLLQVARYIHGMGP